MHENQDELVFTVVGDSAAPASRRSNTTDYRSAIQLVTAIPVNEAIEYHRTDRLLTRR